MHQNQVELQRDLYRLLLEPPGETEASVHFLLEKALGLIVKMTSARLGYLELQDASKTRSWSTQHCDDDHVNVIQQCISSGIIAEALAHNETIVTPSAFLDPRFCTNESVKGERIESVLCSPFGNGTERGVIYLQGSNDSDFNQSHCMMDTLLFTRQITPLLSRLRLCAPNKECLPLLQEQYDLDEMVGHSAVFVRRLREAMAIAELDVTVLLTGSSGTGKSILAKAIHKNSSRRNMPFVHLNCANFPDQLVESELFGVCKGAHSSAYANIKGKIAAAEGGTLFLDEIGELPINIQAKLLQFLEAGVYYPLGSHHPISADVRIVTASNVDFENAMKDGRFRKDLFYRINVFPVHVPSLSERTDDIPALIEHFSRVYCNKFKIPIIDFSPDAVLELQGCEWPGNIRQFENRIQQAILRAKTDASQTVLPRHLGLNAEKTDNITEKTLSYRDGKTRWERHFIQARLSRHNWNVTETARSLGLSRSYINSLLSSHGLQRDSSQKKA